MFSISLKCQQKSENFWISASYCIPKNGFPCGRCHQNKLLSSSLSATEIYLPHFEHCSICEDKCYRRDWEHDVTLVHKNTKSRSYDGSAQRSTTLWMRSKGMGTGEGLSNFKIHYILISVISRKVKEICLIDCMCP